MIGVFPDLHHVGDYKTAVNTFTEKGYTPAHKEMDVALNRSLYDQLVRGIAEARKKTEAEVRALIDEGPFLPENALEGGPRRRRGVRGPGEGEASRGRRAATTTTTSTASTTRASVLRRSGLNRGPRIGVIYALGRYHRRPERLRSAQRFGRRLRHAHRVHPPRTA